MRTGKIKSARKINTRYLISEDEDFDQDESGVSIERSTVVFEKSDSARFDDEDAEEDNFYIDVLESDRQVRFVVFCCCSSMSWQVIYHGKVVFPWCNCSCRSLCDCLP